MALLYLLRTKKEKEKKKPHQTPKHDRRKGIWLFSATWHSESPKPRHIACLKSPSPCGLEVRGESRCRAAPAATFASHRAASLPSTGREGGREGGGRPAGTARPANHPRAAPLPRVRPAKETSPDRRPRRPRRRGTSPVTHAAPPPPTPHPAPPAGCEVSSQGQRLGGSARGGAAAAAINRRPDLPPRCRSPTAPRDPRGTGGCARPRLPSSAGGGGGGGARSPRYHLGTLTRTQAAPPSPGAGAPRRPSERSAAYLARWWKPARCLASPRRHTAPAPARSRFSRGESFLTSAREGGRGTPPACLPACRARCPLGRAAAAPGLPLPPATGRQAGREGGEGEREEGGGAAGTGAPRRRKGRAPRRSAGGAVAAAREAWPLGPLAGSGGARPRLAGVRCEAPGTTDFAVGAAVKSQSGPRWRQRRVQPHPQQRLPRPGSRRAAGGWVRPRPPRGGRRRDPSAGFGMCRCPGAGPGRASAGSASLALEARGRLGAWVPRSWRPTASGFAVSPQRRAHVHVSEQRGTGPSGQYRT